MKRMDRIIELRARVLAFGLLLAVSFSLLGNGAGYKYFKNYSYLDYDHHPQNWGVAQNEDGLIFVANQGGLLVYDGVEWQLNVVPNYIVRSLAIADGKIYIGGQNELGYFEADAGGALKYTSFVHLLDEGARNFSTVWRVHATDQGIFFRTSKYLFRLEGQTMRHWQSGESFWSSFDSDGEFLVQEKGRGLLKLNGGTLEPFPGGELFADKIVLLTPLYEGEVQGSSFILGTRNAEFYLFDGFEFQPYKTGVADYLKTNKFSQGIRLKSGDTALATLNGGLAIMGTEGELKHVFDKSSGLQDQNVKSVFEDREGNLWLALNKGLSRIEYRSPLYVYDDRMELPDMVLSVAWMQGYLYAGTSEGLFVMEPDASEFKPVRGVTASCWNLTPIGDSVLAATSEGLFHVDPRYYSPRKRIDALTLALSPTERNPGIIWCGTAQGLVQLRFEGNRYLGKRSIESVTQLIRFIVEDYDGILWLTTYNWQVMRVELKKDNLPANIAVYTAENGLPQGELFPAKAAGRVVFATEHGLFRFDERKNAFVPDKPLGDEFAGGDNGKPVFRLAEDVNRAIWFHSKSVNYRAIPGSGNIYTIDSTSLRRIPLIQTNTLYPEPSADNIFIGSTDGLIRYDATFENGDTQAPDPLIRSITAGTGAVYKGFDHGILDRSLEEQPRFEYKDRNLQFDFALPSFAGQSQNLYRSILEGYDKTWSSWEDKTARNYTNLNPGIYTFRVQAQNAFGATSDESSFRFRVLPPFYLAWWALTLYGLALVALVFFIVRWRLHKLVQDKLKLERVVKERTVEINQKNRQLEEKTIELQDKSEKLQEMNKIKSRFFANISHEFRTPLTLIMSPLEQLISEKDTNVPLETFEVMLRNSQRLLTSINQLLDLSRFDSNQMKLQASKQDLIPFIENAVASFQYMAEQKSITLKFTHSEFWMHLYFDTRKMEDVLYNLLVNAVKFTPSGGNITISVSNDSQSHSSHQAFVRISVKDTGTGIPKDQLEHIFDRFFQADNVQDNAYKGTGIGLALTREIVHLHHGTIDVHSQQGKGTEFVVKLPLGKRHLKSHQIIDVPAEAPTPKPRHLDLIPTQPSPGSQREVDMPEEENLDATEEKTVVLVVEDHDDVRHYIRKSLEPQYTVVEAVDGKEGLAKALKQIPDLIVSDIMMPKLDGYKLCDALKKDIATSHIPIILLTAKASEENMLQGLETGADDYITKPFNTQMLLARIKNLIELRRQLQLKIQRQKTLLPSEISVTSTDETFLKEFQQTIEDNLADQNFGPDELSKKLCMGRSTLFKKIKALTGETPNQFIQSYRLERAAQLLKQNFGNVTEVAFAVGFTSSAYFAKCFKDKFHQSPTTYQSTESQPT